MPGTVVSQVQIAWFALLQTIPDEEPEVLHLVPATQFSASQARRLCGPVAAITTLCPEITGGEVKCISIRDKTVPANLHFTCAASQRYVLVFCWPGEWDREVAAAVGAAMTQILLASLGRPASWLQGASTNGETTDAASHSQASGQAPGRLHAGAQQLLDRLLLFALDQLIGNWATSTAPCLTQLMLRFPDATPACCLSPQLCSTLESDLKRMELIGMQPAHPLVDTYGFPPQHAIWSCSFCSGLLVGSRMGPSMVRAVWLLCWAQSLFQRTASHPPLLLVQPVDLSSVAPLGGHEGGRYALIIAGMGIHLVCMVIGLRTDVSLDDLSGCVEVAAVQATVHDITVGYGSALAAEVGSNGLQHLLEPKTHVGLTASRAKGASEARKHGQGRFPSQLHESLSLGIPHPGWLILHPLPGADVTESPVAQGLFLTTAAQAWHMLQGLSMASPSNPSKEELQPGAEPRVSVRLPDALDVHMFNGHMQSGDQIVTGRLHDSSSATFIWHETSAAATTIDKAMQELHAAAGRLQAGADRAS